MSITLPTIYLVRHGETKWSRNGRHTGITDLPLTAHGEATARELGPWFADVPFAQVLTSPMDRAVRTCELAGLGAQAEIAVDLSEWNYGDYEGRSSAGVGREVPDWNVFEDGCPNGEMPDEVSARADRLIARLRAVKGNVALFSHGQFGCALAVRWIGLAVLEGQHFALDAASVSILGPKPGHPMIPVISQWNTMPSTLVRH